jgi:hypothetical protein
MITRDLRRVGQVERAILVYSLHASSILFEREF